MVVVHGSHLEMSSSRRIFGRFCTFSTVFIQFTPHETVESFILTGMVTGSLECWKMLF
jgi:hypothetical protein